MAKHTAHATYTDAELLELTRAQIATITATGQVSSDGGFALTRAHLPYLWEQVAALERRIAAASSSSASTDNLARIGRA